MGFAAFESTELAFAAFLQSAGSLSYTVLITYCAVLPHQGHGTWTAIFSGVLLNESVAGRFHVSNRVIYAYLTVSALHGLWNGIPMVISSFIPSPNADLIGLAAIGAIGILILYRQWRKAEKELIPFT